MIPVVVGSNPIIHPTFHFPEGWGASFFYDSTVPQSIQDGRTYLILEVNRAYCDLIGYTREELIGMQITDLSPAEDREQIEAARARHQQDADELPATGQVAAEIRGRRLLHKAGHVVHYNLLARWFVGPEGRLYAHASIIDCTLEIHAQQLLEEQFTAQLQDFDNAPVGMFLVDADFRTSRVNQMFTSMLGAARAPVLRQPDPFSLYGDAAAGEIMRAHWSRSASSDCTSHSRVTLRVEQRVNWYELFTRRIASVGRPVRYQTVVIDVTKEHLLADELRKMVLQQTALLRNAGAGIAYVRDGLILRANSVFARLLQSGTNPLPEQALAHQRLDQVLHCTPSWPSIQAQALQALTTASEYQCVVLFQDATERSVQLRLQWLDPQRPAGGMVLTLVDLTQVLHARRVEENLARSQAEFQQLGESIEDALLIVDRELSRALYLNPSVPEVFGLPAAQLAADPARFLEACDPEQAERLRTQCRVLQVHRPQTIELARMLPSKDVQTLRIRITVLKSRPEFILMVCEDVTALRQAQVRQQAEIEQQRELLVREVHHRIKNNLQGVAGLLQQRARLRPELAADMAMASAQIHAIAHVHGLQLKGKGTTDLIALIEAIAAIHHVQPLANQINLQITLPAQGVRPVVNEPEAVPTALILNELISNAIRHVQAPDGVAMSLSVPQPGTCLIRISNPGVLPDDFSFEGVKPGATGLGLIKAMMPRKGARLLIQSVQGQVQVDWRLSAPIVDFPETTPKAGSMLEQL